jgi:DNA-binding CsgD family transcriptional regulator
MKRTIPLISLAGFAALLIFLSDYSDTSAGLVGEKNRVLFYFVSVQGSSLLAAIALRLIEKPNTTLLGRVGVVALCSSHIISYFDFFFRPPEQLQLLIGPLCGIGIVLVGHYHFTQLQFFKNSRSKLVMVCAVAGLIKIPMLCLSGIGLMIGMSLLTVIAVLAPVIGYSSNSSEEAIQLNVLFDRCWILVTGLLISLSVSSMGWTSVFVGQSDLSSFGWGAKLGLAFGFSLGALAVWAILRVFSQRVGNLGEIAAILTVAFSVCAWFALVWQGGLLLLGSQTEFTAQLVYNVFTGFAQSVFFLFLLKKLSEVSGSYNRLTYSSLVCVVVGCYTLMIALQYVFGIAVSSAIDLIIKVLFIVVAGIYLIAHNQGPSLYEQANEIFNERIDLFALHFGLTSRESQIAAHMLRGYSTPRIAEIEFLSAGTVKTHIHHIFAKTGVHSRDEIIGLFDSTKSR